MRAKQDEATTHHRERRTPNRSRGPETDQPIEPSAETSGKTRICARHPRTRTRNQQHCSNVTLRLARAPPPDETPIRTGTAPERTPSPH